MSIFGWLKGKKERHTFEDSDRDLSKEVRKQQQHLRILEIQREAKLNELSFRRDMLELQQDIDRLTEEESDSPNDWKAELVRALAPIIPAIYAKFNGSAVVQPKDSVGQISEPDNSSPPEQQQDTSKVTDEKLKKLWADTDPKLKAMTKFMTDEKIKKLITDKTGIIDEDTLNRAIMVIRGRTA